MKRIKRRMYELVIEPPPGDRLGNFISYFILALIASNVIIGIFESVEALNKPYKAFFYYFEYVSVVIFSVEYVLRMWACTEEEGLEHPLKGRLKFAVRPMSLVDFFAILPFYLEALGIDLRFIRVLRLLRLFRLFRVGRFAESFKTLGTVVKSKKEELMISVMVLMIMLILSSSIMFMIEKGAEPGKFTSVPDAMWWGMMTITTIGYGDLVPTTIWGKLFGAIIGFLGICVFALPVGILGSGFIEEVEKKGEAEKEALHNQILEGYANTIKSFEEKPFTYCPHCGEHLISRQSEGASSTKKDT